MKKRIFIANVALLLVADIALTGYILNKRNKFNNEVPVFTKPTISQEQTVQTEPTKLDYIIEEETEIPEVTEEPVIEEKKEIIKQEVGVIKNDTVAYATPSEYGLEIGKLSIGENAYKILSDASGYDLVRNDNNAIFFIKNEDITYTGEEVEAEYKIERKNDIVLTTTKLFFRTGPSTDYEAIRLLDEETELQVLGEAEDNWLLVHLNGEVGFVKKDYTYSVLDKINETYPDLNLENLEVKKVVRIKEGINYRKGPSTDDEIIREFSKAETMRVLGENEEWYFGITDDYEIGFVSKSYATDIEGIFIDTDILTQRMRMYNNNQLMYYTRVKTGKDSTPTTEGYFKIDWMGEHANIVGDIVVNYWMHYYDGEGIHDFEACTSYGENDYHYAGSNGCTRTPLENVAKIYQKASLGTPVIVHK